MTRILILCTGNSCRSQMAEGFLKSFDDPAEAKGSEEEIIAVFRRVRDEIKNDFMEFYQ